MSCALSRLPRRRPQTGNVDRGQLVRRRHPWVVVHHRSSSCMSFFRAHPATDECAAIDGRTLGSLHSQRDFPQQHVTKSTKYLLLLSCFGPSTPKQPRDWQASGVCRLTTAPVRIGAMLGAHHLLFPATCVLYSYHQLHSAVFSLPMGRYGCLYYTRGSDFQGADLWACGLSSMVIPKLTDSHHINKAFARPHTLARWHTKVSQIWR